jgi:hypothetical protein
MVTHRGDRESDLYEAWARSVIASCFAGAAADGEGIDDCMVRQFVPGLRARAVCVGGGVRGK